MGTWEGSSVVLKTTGSAKKWSQRGSAGGYGVKSSSFKEKGFREVRLLEILDLKTHVIAFPISV